MSLFDVFQNFLSLLDYWWIAFFIAALVSFIDIWGRYWRLWFFYKARKDWIFLRVNLPRDSEKTPLAMEQVLTGMHGIAKRYFYWSDRYIWKERTETMSLEIVGIGGSINFIIGASKKHEDMVRGAVFSHFGEAEIDIVSDYTYAVPDDPILEHWNIVGSGFKLDQDSIFPIKTYESWLLSDELEETRKNDPLAVLAESYSALKAGEQLWLQFVISPLISTEWEKWHKRARAFRKNIDRPGDEKASIGEETVEGGRGFFRALIGKEPFEKKEEKIKFRFPSTVDVLIIKAITSKIELPIFEVSMRNIYITTKESYNKYRMSLLAGSLRMHADSTSNHFGMDNSDRIRVKYFPEFFREYRLDYKKRRLLKHYRMRYLKEGKNSSFYLNTKELASVFHFPGRTVSAPGLKRVPFKTSKPPEELPTL
ncbi:MAG: hypothetical protein AAB593_01040 [Patescibacteria group bacterium]